MSEQIIPVDPTNTSLALATLVTFFVAYAFVGNWVGYALSIGAHLLIHAGTF